MLRLARSRLRCALACAANACSLLPRSSHAYPPSLHSLPRIQGTTAAASEGPAVAICNEQSKSTPLGLTQSE